MILSRRQAHFYIIVALSCALPLVFLAGLIWRPSVPTVDEGADDLFAAANFATAAPETVIGSEAIAVSGVDVQAETAAIDGQLLLRLTPTQPLQFADILVYWVAGETVPEAIAADALLLGPLAGDSTRGFPLPEAVQEQSGQLLFYSRAQDTLITATPLPATLLP